MVAQSEQTFLAIAQGNAAKASREDPGVQRHGALLREGRERRAWTNRLPERVRDHVKGDGRSHSVGIPTGSAIAFRAERTQKSQTERGE